MTQEEMQKIFESLGLKEGIGKQSKTGKHTIQSPKQEEMITMLKSMKGIFMQQLQQEEAELSVLREKLVKAKKGGCDG